MLTATMPVTLTSTPVASSTGGSTSSRSRLTSASVASSCGPSVGATIHSTAVPVLVGLGPEDDGHAGIGRRRRR